LELVRGEVETIHRQFQTEKNETWQAEFGAWTQKCQQLDRTDLDAIQQLIKEGESLADRRDVDPRLRDVVQPGLKKLGDDYQNQMATQTEAQLIQRVVGALDERAKYIRSLQNYIEKFGHTPRAADFKKVVENESELWDGVEAWEQLIDSWATLQVKGISPARAGDCIERAETLLEQHPGFPAAETVRKIVEYLNPIRARMDPSGEKIADRLLPTVGASPLVRDTFMVLRQRPGQKTPIRYYFRDEEPKAQWKSLRVAHLTYLQNDQVRTVDIPHEEVRSPKSEDGDSYDWTSPQQKFFDVLTQQLRELDDSTWEPVFLRIIQHLYEDPLMDPVLKVQLLSLILPTACDGSYAIQQAFGPWRDRVEKASADGSVNFAADWVDPENSLAERAREGAQDLLDSLDDGTGMQRAILRAGEAWKEMLAPRAWRRHRCVGCLLRDDAQNWTCALNSEAQRLSGDLYVVHPAEGKTPLFTRIGSLADGRATLTGTAGRTEGRPVFVQLTPSTR
jgi:hypothetical protein